MLSLPLRFVYGDAYQLNTGDYVADGLVAQWDAVENAGPDTHDPDATIWKDLTGNGLDWTINLSKANWTDKALVFPEAGQCGTMPNKSSNDFKNKLSTIEFVYANEKSRHGVIFCPGFGAKSYLYTDANNHVGFYGESTTSKHYGCAVTLNTTNCFSAIYNRTGDIPTGVKSFLLNGSAGTITGMGDWWDGSLYVPFLGGRSSDSKVNVKGRLCTLRIYNRELTAAEQDRNYRIDQYRFQNGAFPSDIKFVRMSAPPGTSVASGVTFTDLATGDALSHELFNVTFSAPDTAGNVVISAIGKDGSDYAGISSHCCIASGSLPYYPIQIDYPSDLVDVTIIGEAGKVQDNRYEYGSQVTISVAAKDGVSPFGSWLVGVEGDDVYSSEIEYTVGNDNHLVPYVKTGWTYANGKLSDGYWSIPATANGMELTTKNTSENLIGGVVPVDLFTKPIADGYSLVAVGGKTFEDKGALTEVLLPDTVTNLAANSFAGCTKLANVRLRNDSIAIIGSKAFNGCSKLVGFNGTHDVIFTNLTSIGEMAFTGCSSLTGKVEINGRDLMGISNPGAGSGVFENCVQIKECIIGDNVTNICQYLIFNCNSVTNLYLGRGVRRIPTRIAYIKDAASYGNSHLKTLTMAGDIESIDAGAFCRCPLESINGGTDIVLRGLDTFGKGVFSASKITSVIIDGKEGVTSPDGYNINFGCFEGCKSLKNVVLEGSFTTLNAYPFLDCTALTNIVLNASFSNFTDRFFGNCTALQTVKMGAFPTATHKDTFKDLSGKKILFSVPVTPEWTEFISDYVRPWDSLDDNEKLAFSNRFPGRKHPVGLVNVSVTADNVYAPTNQWITTYYPNPPATIMLLQ